MVWQCSKCSCLGLKPQYWILLQPQPFAVAHRFVGFRDLPERQLNCFE